MYSKELLNFLLLCLANKILNIEGINNKLNPKVLRKMYLKGEEITDTKEVNRNFKEATDKILTKLITEIHRINFNNKTTIIVNPILTINKLDSEAKSKVSKELTKMRYSQDSQNLINSIISQMIRIKIGHLVNNSLIISIKTEVILHNKIQELRKEEEINTRKKHNNK